ncbi:MAG TPA: hypothetical protein VNQ80_07785 [Parapedobacter sp.]|uniref:hypothetical protein n=1 Tax=Parapedobacter sp. TaxID=1958893 RepID=UPI002B9D356A|nr:hypothetical protein [Parapedobacter sp.]HWK57220.1 hypothetical protein [Parapedobacter sp.]
MQLKNIEPAISYTYGDQPATCPKCGNRTTVYETTGLPVVQQHTSLSANCRYTFFQVAEEDNHP